MKKRRYVGPTSLNHALAFIITNIAQIQKNQLVLDPFVGTASLLIAVSHFGGICFGWDIDIRVLKGDMYAGSVKDQSKRDILTTFEDYGLAKPELIRMDNAFMTRHLNLPFAENSLQAIITDPPYGILSIIMFYSI